MLFNCTTISAPDTVENALPITGKFALKNMASGKTLGMDGWVWYLTTNGECVEFEYELDSDKVWGVLKLPSGKVIAFHNNYFGWWSKHNGSNQRFRMEGNFLILKTGVVVMPKNNGRITGTNRPVCDDDSQQWEILNSCPN